MIPSCSHTGTPSIEFDGFLHFTSSTTSGSACLMIARTRASASPRQSPNAAILVSINWEGETSPPPFGVPLLFLIVLSPSSTWLVLSTQAEQKQVEICAAFEI